MLRFVLEFKCLIWFMFIKMSSLYGVRDGKKEYCILVLVKNYKLLIW